MLTLAALALALAGAADTFTVVFGTIVQQATTEEYRGRVSATDFLVGSSGGQIGGLEAGTLGSLTTPAVGALAGGLPTTAWAALTCLLLPAFARFESQPRQHARQGA